MNQETYILSLEGKDIITNNMNYITKPKKSYKATLPYSLESIKIRELAPQSFWTENNKEKSNVLVQVTFEYSVGETYNNRNGKESKRTLISCKDIRKKLYTEGFQVNGIDYVAYKRSASMARLGKMLFIRKDIFEPMMDWTNRGIDTKKISENLAGYCSYNALTLSSIIDTISILPHQILVLKDETSTFTELVMAVTDENGKLICKKEKREIENNIWDGESLLDSSVFEENGYADKGMLLLRNRFFKSCSFQTHIQQFFSDNGITDISQLQGYTRAKQISDIKMIVTESSIKSLKFGTLDMFFDTLDSTFGIVKFEKPTKYDDHVLTNYQLLNSTKLDRDKLKKLVEYDIEYIKKLRTDISFFKQHLKLADISADRIDCEDISSNSLVLTMLQVNDSFADTDFFVNFRADVIDSYINKLRRGRIKVKGNNSVLCGNGYELLQASIGTYKHDVSVLQGSQIYSTKFDFGEKLLGCRNPHICAGNLLLAVNTNCPEITRYFAKSDEIVHVNAIGINIQQKLNGMDYDSDQLLLTNNRILVEAVGKNYDMFLVPTSFVESSSKKRANTLEQRADLDYQTSVNKIGEICNYAQVLQSVYFDSGDEELLDDLVKLSIMSGLEIDMAKKEFNISNTKELRYIRQKHEDILLPAFFKVTAPASTKKKKTQKYDCTMDVLQTVIRMELAKLDRSKRKSSDRINALNQISAHISKTGNEDIANKVISIVEKQNNKIKAIWANELIEAKEKYERASIQYNILLEQVKELKVDTLVIKKILLKLEKDENPKKIERKLITVLFEAFPEEFMNLFRWSKAYEELGA